MDAMESRKTSGSSLDVSHCVRALSTLLCDDDDSRAFRDQQMVIDSGGCELLVGMMQRFPKEFDLCLHIIKILRWLAELHIDGFLSVSRAGGCSVIVKAMRTFLDRREMWDEGLEAVFHLSYCSLQPAPTMIRDMVGENNAAIAAAGGLEVVVTILHKTPHNEARLSEKRCLHGFRILSSIEIPQRDVPMACTTMLHVLNASRGVEEVQQQGLNVLRKLIVATSSLPNEVCRDIIEMLISRMREYPRQVLVVSCALITLRHLAGMGPQNCTWIIAGGACDEVIKMGPSSIMTTRSMAVSCMKVCMELFAILSRDHAASLHPFIVSWVVGAVRKYIPRSQQVDMYPIGMETIRNLATIETLRTRMIEEKGVVAAISAGLRQGIKSADRSLCENALHALAHISTGQVTIEDKNVCAVVLRAMRDFPRDPAVFRGGCKAISALSRYADVKTELINLGAVEEVVMGMRVFSEDADVQLDTTSAICHLIRHLDESSLLWKRVADLTVWDCVKALSAFPTHREICQRVLWILDTTHGVHGTIIINAGACEAILETLRASPDHGLLYCQGLRTIAHLCAHEAEAPKRVLDAGGSAGKKGPTVPSTLQCTDDFSPMLQFWWTRSHPLSTASVTRFALLHWRLFVRSANGVMRPSECYSILVCSGRHLPRSGLSRIVIGAIVKACCSSTTCVPPAKKKWRQGSTGW